MSCYCDTSLVDPAFADMPRLRGACLVRGQPRDGALGPPAKVPTPPSRLQVGADISIRERPPGSEAAMWGPPGFVTLGAEPGGSRIALCSVDLDAAQGFLSWEIMTPRQDRCHPQE